MNDDLAKVIGPEKRGRIRCVGKVVMAKDKVSSSQDPQVPQLKSRIIELEEEMKETKESKERQEAEIREMKINQEVMVRFMAIFKEQLPNASLSNVFNGLNKKVGMDPCGAHNHHLSGNPTSSLASQYPSSSILFLYLSQILYVKADVSCDIYSLIMCLLLPAYCNYS